MRSDGLAMLPACQRLDITVTSKDGVVAGIAAYGNAFGVRILVERPFTFNVMKEISCIRALAAGLCKTDDMRTAAQRSG